MQATRESAFRKEGLGARVAPFALGALVGLLHVVFQDLREGDVDQIVLGLLGTLAVVAAAMVVPWQRLPPALEALVPYLCITLVFALCMSSEGPKTPFGLLLLLPDFWLALYGTRTQLAVGFGLSAVVLFVPGSIDPISGRISHLYVEQGLLMIALFVPMCLTTQSLVMRIRRQRSEVEALSLTDPLTGVAMLDFDHLKRFNDTHGHQVGDRLLAEATAAWQRHLRDADLLARVGGEEFIVVLPECDTQLAVQIVDRLRAATPFGQTCSAGVARWDGSESVEDLIGRADAALYQAKEQERDRTVVPERIS